MQNALSFNRETKLISVRTTEFTGVHGVEATYRPNMFSGTNAFALSDEGGRIRVESA